MTDPQPSGISGVPVSIWIALLVGLAGAFALSQRPFQDTRPPNSSVPLHHHRLEDGQTIEARLWEDPLTAVALARQGGALTPYGMTELSQDVQEHLVDGGSRLLVLAVMVTGEPYTDDAETRRRTRYAVLAGLYRSRFVPVDTDHVGYLHEAPADAASAAGGKKSEKNSAARGSLLSARNSAVFEWFRRDTAASNAKGAIPQSPQSSGPEHVLVLWLDQGGFRNRPLEKLSRFMTSIAGTDDQRVKVAVLGPASSDGLYAIYNELPRADAPEASEIADLRRMDFYSSRATASDRSITDQEDVHVSERLSNSTNGHVRLFRTVASDQDVAGAVYKELGRRGITDFGRIALVAERDTLYARNMGSYFTGCRNPPRNDPSPLPNQAATDRHHVACFTYLKGLDGLLPPAPASLASSTSQAPLLGSVEAAAPVAPLAVPEPSTVPDEATGPAQFDYLRRLATTIAALRKSRPHIRAIGVVSSDVYDKLLVLQALHNALPGAVYFTFDLDARLLEQNSLPWSRQLIVGSSLGLQLRPELQGDIPPFRDSYQTATFFSSLLAVHHFMDPDTSAPGKDGSSAALQWTSQPRIFEIGRSQEFDLTANPVDTTCDLNNCPVAVAARNSFFWTMPSSRWKGLLVGLMMAVLTLAAVGLAVGVRGLAGLSRTHVVPWLGPRRWNNEVSSAVMVAGVVLAIFLSWPLIVRYITDNGATVPAPFFSGANPSASSIVDALAIIAVVLLVIRGQRKLHDNAESVGREFGLKMSRRKLIQWHRGALREAHQRKKTAACSDAQTRPGELPGWLTWIWFPLRPLSRRSGIDLADGEVSELEAMTAQYLHRGTAAARALRVAPVTLFVVVCLVIPLEEIPGIAHFGRLADWASLFGLLAMQFLIFWTADALLLSRSFILALKRDKPNWPAAMDTLGLPKQEAMLWLDLRLVAARTRGVSRLLWYPSLLIAAMAAAAVTVEFGEFQFANNPVALGFGALFVIGAAIALRRAAEALKTEVRRCFQNNRLRAPDAPLARQIELLVERIDRLREGAFAPYSEQPIVRAVLVPAATYGATLGIQYLHV